MPGLFLVSALTYKVAETGDIVAPKQHVNAFIVVFKASTSFNKVSLALSGALSTQSWPN